VVAPRGARVPSFGTASVGTQFEVVRAGFGGDVCACGEAGAGGACANVTTGINASAQPTAMENFIVMKGKRRRRADVPCGK